MTKEHYIEMPKENKTKTDSYFDSQHYEMACKSFESSIFCHKDIQEPNPELFFKLANRELMLNHLETATIKFSEYLETVEPSLENKMNRAKAHYFKVLAYI